MSSMQEPATLKAATTYNMASDHFDAEPLSFWNRHGKAAVDLLDLTPGSRVLDVGCGTGASAIPAAKAVGPEGHVLGLDVAAKMLNCTRRKARLEDLSNIKFETRDMTTLGAETGQFDAVISVFSIFFVVDMERQCERLWRLVRPGGKMVVTVWGINAFQPAAAIFSEELRWLKPDAHTGARPWARLADTASFRQTLLDGGVTAPQFWPVTDTQPLATAEDWWTVAMGSGYRWEIEQLTLGDQTSLRESVTARLRSEEVCEVGTSVIHATAMKPVAR